MRQYILFFSAVFWLKVINLALLHNGYAQRLKPAREASGQLAYFKAANKKEIDAKIGLYVGYRPSRLQKGGISFVYPYSVYSAKLWGGPLFTDSLVYRKYISQDISWGVGLGGTLEMGEKEGFWFHIKGEGLIARNFEGANMDLGAGYELSPWEKVYFQPMLLYSFGWTWLQMGELYRGTGSGNTEWFIQVRNKRFYSDVKVNLRTFYMALRPMFTLSYAANSRFMARAGVGYALPFFHTLAIRFVGRVENNVLESVVSDPLYTGSGFIYNGAPTDRSFQSFGGLMFNLEFLYTFKD